MMGDSDLLLRGSRAAFSICHAVVGKTSHGYMQQGKVQCAGGVGIKEHNSAPPSLLFCLFEDPSPPNNRG
jgi:hypothetical protein